MAGKEMASQVLERPGTRPTDRMPTVDTNILRKDHPEVPTPAEETPHACFEGWIRYRWEGRPSRRP